MNSLAGLLAQPWVRRIGWTLLQFLWQGTALALVFAGARTVLRCWLSARARYNMSCLALGAMAAAPLVTFCLTPGMGNRPVPIGSWPFASVDAWQPVLSWFTAVWAAGVLVFSVRLIFGWRYTTRLRKVGVEPAKAEWQRTFDTLIARLRISRPVRLLVSSVVEVPTVVGWLRPVVLAPTAALTGLPPEYVTALLSHELAHVLRQDYLVNILQSVVEAIFFYHPAVWWVSKQIRAEREYCCDELAVAAIGDALVYATALAELEARRPTHGGVALAANDGSLLNRIRRLVKEPLPVHYALPGAGAAWAMSLLWLVGVVATVCHGAPVSHGTKDANVRTLLADPLASALIALPSNPHPLLTALWYGPGPFVPLPQAAQSAMNNLHLGGSVRDALTGEPVKQAIVIVSEAPSQTSARRDAASDTAPAQGPHSVARIVITDSAGAFRFAGLAGGRYAIHVEKPGFQWGEDVMEEHIMEIGASRDDFNIRVTPLARIAGNVVDQEGEPVNEASVRLFRSLVYDGRRGLFETSRSVTDDLGHYHFADLEPGSYYVFATGRSGNVTTPAMQAAHGSRQAYTPAYFPKTTEAAAAAPVMVAAGQREEAKVVVTMEPSFAVKGTLQNLQRGRQVQLELRRDGQNTGIHRVAVLQGTGAFEIWDVTPGNYRLRAMQGDWPANVTMAQRRIQVKAGDVTGVQLNLAPGATVHGAVHAVDSDGSKPIHVQAHLEDVDREGYEGFPLFTETAEGNWTMPGVPEGRYRLFVHASNGYVASAMSGDRDLLHGGELVVNAGTTPESLEITVRSDGGSIQGTVSSETGEAAQHGWVLLCQLGGEERLTASADHSHFAFNNLAPGDYRAYLLRDINDMEYRNPEVLQRLRNGVSVRVGAKEKVALELTEVSQ
jgi:protocatechuate 3,4-dioxygenase beta subunit